MASIDLQLQKLRDREKQLNHEKLKIEFLNHILDSAREYNHKAFADVKDEVVGLLEKLTEAAVESIISNVTAIVAPVVTSIAPQDSAPQASTASTQKKSDDGVGPNEQLAFALDNRHLAGKTVTVANDKNMTVRGKVVGLDAPFVLVQTDTGPVIKVPLDKVSVG